MGKNCKNCGAANSDPNQNFCTSKCRTNWKKAHEVKGAKKYYSDPLNLGITGRGAIESDTHNQS